MFVRFESRRRIITMNYNKPEIVKLVLALDAIHTTEGNKGSSPPDGDPFSDQTTVGAYESDE
jgi:hypothetical protein